MKRTITLLATCAVMALAQPAAAQSNNCGPRANVLQVLNGKYGESLRSRGISSRGDAMVEMYANLDSGTWTALVSYPDGRACIVGSGASWEEMNEPAGEPA